MSARLTLICHASTHAVRAAVFPRDEAIEKLGQQRAAALAAQLGRIDVAWTAPELRTRQKDRDVLTLATSVTNGRWRLSG